jgi:4-oxalocrotonate tautomerase
MPYVRIEITDGATYEQKLQIYKETTEMLQRILNKKPEYTFVVIEEVENKSWGHMGTSVHEIRMAQAAGLPVPAMGQKTVTGKKPAAKKATAKAPAKKAAARVSAPIKRGAAKK